MKLLKKISLAYTLQVFAVILIFGFAGSSAENKSNSTFTDTVLPFDINEPNSDKPVKDSLLIKKTNTGLPSRIVNARN
jgi:hypothetical protein